MRDKRLNIVKLASAFLLKRIFNRGNSKGKLYYSKLRLLSDTYRDFKALKQKRPVRSELLKYRSKKKRHARSMNQSSEIDSTYVGISKRQRFLGLARATRDSYIPKLAGSVTQLASGVSTRAFGSNDLYDEQGRIKYPKDTKILLFPSYTRQVNDKYIVDVKGWLSCPGLMTRKNRLILSLAKQITRYGSNSATSNQALDRLEDDDLEQDALGSNGSSDTESIRSEISSTNMNSNSESVVQLNRKTTNSSLQSNLSNSDDLIKERLACFIAKTIPNAELTVTIGSKVEIPLESLQKQSVITDANGHFETRIEVDYEPSVVNVSAATDATIFSFDEVNLYQNDGLGVISDIDDTIKLTGVIGDKRELMSNLLLKDYSLWIISSVIQWFSELERLGCRFYYVSNSPWQLYSTINAYFGTAGLPKGAITLKQYTGNIISSLMEPSSSRKKKALYRILEDFPEKRFICVGDSGEHDLEAYVDLARQHPNNIVAIYIRYVNDSLSDNDDYKIFKEIERILTLDWQRKAKVKGSTSKVEVEDLIDLSDSPPPQQIAELRYSKLPPMIPRKPQSLRGNNVSKNPPLPARNKTRTESNINFNSEINSNQISGPKTPVDDKLPKSDEYTFNTGNETLMNNLQNVYNSHSLIELEEIDPKGARNLERVMTAIEILKDTDIEIKFFTDDDSDFFQRSLNRLANENKQPNII